jgi:uncharacterized protein YbaR (Trm112 family)/SAM-dependent methyltransferase
MRPSPPLSLYDLLACPRCKAPVARHEQRLVCPRCAQSYPIVDGVPVMFPDGRVPNFQHQHELTVRSGYLPWIERLVMQSLPPDAIVLDLGAGNMACNLPHVIRMDITLTPFVDVVGDAHALPFLPGTFDFVFSLAVIEHLRQPFAAAQEMAGALRPGGYVYGECNFVFPYHGYPYHFFNASQQGLEQVFAPFTALRSGAAPYQMPSFAVRSILTTYRRLLAHAGDAPLQHLLDQLEQVCRQPLGTYDQYFTEAAALQLAAGVFFFGVKSADGSSEVIPAVVQGAWRHDPALQGRFPTMLDLGHVENIMLWAKSAGRQQDPAIDAYLTQCAPFRKRVDMDHADWRAFQAEPIVEPAFGHIADASDEPTSLDQLALELAGRDGYIARLEEDIARKNRHIAHLEALIRQFEDGRVMRLLRSLRK